MLYSFLYFSCFFNGYMACCLTFFLALIWYFVCMLQNELNISGKCSPENVSKSKNTHLFANISIKNSHVKIDGNPQLNLIFVLFAHTPNDWHFHFSNMLQVNAPQKPIFCFYLSRLSRMQFQFQKKIQFEWLLIENHSKNKV